MKASISHLHRAGRLRVTTAIMCTCWIAGCGGTTSPEVGPAGTVTGTVTYKNEPVTEGSVQLYSTETGKSGMAELGEGGKFTLADPLPVGKYKVSVMPPSEPPPTSPTPVPMKKYDNIPEKYRTELTTDLSADIKEGENSLTLNME